MGWLDGGTEMVVGGLPIAHDGGRDGAAGCCIACGVAISMAVGIAAAVRLTRYNVHV